MIYHLNDLEGKVAFLGRVLPVGSASDLTKVYFNWTCTGFRCTFVASKVRALIEGTSMKMLEKTEKTSIGVRMDDGEDLQNRYVLEDGEQWLTLFESQPAEEHTIEVLKLSECVRGKAALMALEVEGELLPIGTDTRPLIEFVGDSITCGYGNEASGRDEPFRPEEENGFMSYAAQTARLLHMRGQLISVSGISVAMDRSRSMPFSFPAMEELYAYTDKLTEELIYSGAKEDFSPMKWDFKANRPKVLVLNLGTNDVNAYKMAEDLKKAREFFHTHYRAFLETLRQLNGPDTYIIAALGPLDYYLYDEIRDIVQEYISDTHDERIECFKFGPVIQWSENYGADGHPSMATHIRMAKELSKHIKEVLS